MIRILYPKSIKVPSEVILVSMLGKLPLNA